MNTPTTLGSTLRKMIPPTLLALLLSLVFFVILFPLGDLKDMVSSKIAEATNNAVFLQFNKFNFNFTPLGLTFTDVTVETNFLPVISAEEFSISPAIGGLISRKPYGSIHAERLLEGNLFVGLSKGQPTEAGAERQHLELEIEKASLASLREFLKWPFALEGVLTATADAQADMNFTEQPEASITLDIEKFYLPPITMNIPNFGPLSLPDLKLGTARIKGRLSNGKLTIESGELGHKKSDLNGKIKGSIGLNLTMMDGRPVHRIGDYDLQMDIVVTKAYREKAKLFLGFISDYETLTPEGSRFHFRATPTPGMPPFMGPPVFGPPR